MKKGIAIILSFLVLVIVIISMIFNTGKSNQVDWKEIYDSQIAKYKNWQGENYLGHEYIYLNDDDIPELVFYSNDMQFEAIDLYTFFKGELTHLELYDKEGNNITKGNTLFTSAGCQGKLDSYYPKQNIYIQSGMMMGLKSMDAFVMEDGKLYELESLEELKTLSIEDELVLSSRNVEK